MQTNRDILFQVGNLHEWIFFNVKWNPTPIMEFIPWPIKVSSIIFSDGTQQWTAGGGGGGGSMLVAGSGIQLITAPGPPPTITINSDVYSWLQNVNANGHTISGLGGVQVNGNVNITGQYLINGVPISTGGGATVSNTPPSSPSSGQLWFDPVAGQLFVWNGSTWAPSSSGGGGMTQTPWLSNINGAGNDLSNVKTIDATQSYSIGGVPFAVAGP